MTFEQLSREIGVTLRTVQRWEHGEATPRYEDVRKLGFALGKAPDWFYREQERRAA